MNGTKGAPAELARRLAILAPKIMGAFHSLQRHHAAGSAITMRQYQTLILLSVHTHLTVSELCDKLTLAASTCTELVNRLLQLGMVEKHSEEVDRRQVGIQLTEAGREVMEQRQRDMVAMFERLLAEFNPDEAVELLGAFEKINALLQAHFHPPKEEEAEE
jgi:MarR family transcriptional regulator, organic hydroperoxide resistance regulator